MYVDLFTSLGMSLVVSKPVFDTNRAVQSQKMARGLKRKKRDCAICVAKTKALISCTVTAQLICVFVFAYAKSRFSHIEARISIVRISALSSGIPVSTLDLESN